MFEFLVMLLLGSILFKSNGRVSAVNTILSHKMLYLSRGNFIRIIALKEFKKCQDKGKMDLCISSLWQMCYS